MLQYFGLKAVTFLVADPFHQALPLIHKYGGDAKICAYAVALFILVLVGIGLMAGSARTRQGLKSHLGWILIGVMIVAGAGYLVGWIKSDTGHYFGSGNSTILPNVLDQLDVFRALL